MRSYMFIFILVLLAGCGSSEEPSSIDKKKDAQVNYIGNWKVFNERGEFFYISVKPDGSASSTWDKGEEGRWERMDGKIKISWTNGWRDILYSDDGFFKKISFEPGKPLDATPSSHASAERVEVIPAQAQSPSK